MRIPAYCLRVRAANRTPEQRVRTVTFCFTLANSSTSLFYTTALTLHILQGLHFMF
jgi:hypothetical protein